MLIFSFLIVLISLVLILYAIILLNLAITGSRAPLKSPELPRLEDCPAVTIQLPVYNERFVIAQLLDAVSKLDYPRDRLQVQILDDSTDQTSQEIEQIVPQLRSAGMDVQLIHRDVRKGYKAGALINAQAAATGEYVAIFDADFIPPADFLKRTVPYLLKDPGLAFVQARWSYTNARQSLVTRAQALFLDLHFLLEKPIEQKAGFFINFNGSAGIWRKEAIVDVGGWDDEALSDDLDLSLRAYLRGWKALYLPDLCVPGELPADVYSYALQQERWAFGVIQTIRKLWKDILSADLQLPKRLHVIALPGWCFIPLLLIFSIILTIPSLFGAHLSAWLAAGFFSLLISQCLVVIIAQTKLFPDWLKRSLFLPALAGLILGLSVRISKGVLTGLIRTKFLFLRTPKFGAHPSNSMGEGIAGRPPKNDRWASLVETGLVFYAFCAGILAVVNHAWAVLGMCVVFILSLTWIKLTIQNDIK